ncbi:hypothetical protein [Sphingobium baderi]|uniref:Uncharacterized protein n=1 Tax=Sphingobium baderi TaxID=1332080 RepID=A0A0S3EZZ0_9SPHN|nr:hypothetical protein [Sphingobium baderi]ALR20947.1 hypothetical protein ATN00_12200 [Sphingobium baderi]
MSRYTITIHSPARTDNQAIIGYDPPLRTYFVQAFFDADTDGPDLWLGLRINEMATLDALLHAIAERGFAIAGLNAAMIDAIAQEAARPARKSVAERYGLLDRRSAR